MRTARSWTSGENFGDFLMLAPFSIEGASSKSGAVQPCLCEFVWVLLRVYGLQPADAAAAINALVSASNVEVNRPAVEAGLSVLEAGGDFTDGVIAFEGRWLGGETFLSFDKNAVAVLERVGQGARLL
jgi:predicted nucleic-acid-binding protein